MIFALVFLALLDTGLLSVIPSRGTIRLGLLAVLVAVAAMDGRLNRGLVHCKGFWVAVPFITFVALMSDAGAASVGLGMVKFLLYAGVFYMLVVQRNFVSLVCDDRIGRRMLVWFSVILILVGLFKPGDSKWANPNLLGGLAVYSLPLLLLVYPFMRTTFQRRIVYLLMVSALVVCVVNHSRGAFVGGIAMLLPWLVLRKRPQFGVVVFAVVFLSAGLVALVAIDEQVREFAYKGDTELVDDVRLNRLDTSLEHFRERPLLGYGFGLSWSVESSHFKAVLKHGRLSWYVGEFGNSVLAILSGGGLLLLIGFAWLLFAVIKTTVVAMKSLYKYAGATTIYQRMAGALCGCIGMLVHSQAEGWFMSPLTFPTVVFWLLVGVMLDLSARSRVVIKRVRLARLAGAAGNTK